MAEDWKAVAADVAGGLAEAGFSASLRRASTERPTPWTADSIGPGPTIPVIMVWTKTAFMDKKHEQVLATDRFALMTAAAAPTKQDVVMIPAGTGAGEYAILGVDLVAPGNVDLLYKVWLRK